MDVGRMQSGLTAVPPRPLRLGPDQAHAGTVGVVVHLPFRRADHRYVFGSEKVWRAVRTTEYANAPNLAQHRCQFGGERRLSLSHRLGSDVENVTRRQGSTGVAAKPAQGKTRAAPQISRNV